MVKPQKPHTHKSHRSHRSHKARLENKKTKNHPPKTTPLEYVKNRVIFCCFATFAQSINIDTVVADICGDCAFGCTISRSYQTTIANIGDLVGGFSLPLWKMMEFVSWDHDIPYMMGKRTFMFQTNIGDGFTPWIPWTTMHFECPSASPSKLSWRVQFQCIFHLSSAAPSKEHVSEPLLSAITYHKKNIINNKPLCLLITMVCNGN